MAVNNMNVAPSLSNADIIALVRQDDAQGEDDAGEPLPAVTSHQAFAAFKDIQAYLLCHGSDADKLYCILKDLEIILTQTASNTSK